MPKFKMIALTRPVEGREDEYNDWYQNTHLPEVTSLPGIRGAQRYKLAAPMMGYDERSYLAIYDIETDDIQETLASFGTNPPTPSDAANGAPAYIVIFSEFGEYVASKNG
jgi:hypothetical protein